MLQETARSRRLRRRRRRRIRRIRRSQEYEERAEEDEDVGSLQRRKVPTATQSQVHTPIRHRPLHYCHVTTHPPTFSFSFFFKV